MKQLLKGWAFGVLKRKVGAEAVKWVASGSLALWMAPKIEPFAAQFWTVYWPAFQAMLMTIGIEATLTIKVNQVVFSGAVAAILKLILEGGVDTFGLMWANFKSGKPLETPAQPVISAPQADPTVPSDTK